MIWASAAKFKISTRGTGHQRWRWKIQPSSMMSPWKSRFSSMIFPGSSPYLVGGLEHFLFFHILGTITPNWFSYFSDGWNHQPANRGCPIAMLDSQRCRTGEKWDREGLVPGSGRVSGQMAVVQMGQTCNFLGRNWESNRTNFIICYIFYWWLDMVYLCIIYTVYIYIYIYYV